MRGNSSLEGLEAAGGTFHLKDCLVSTTTLWLPEVPPPPLSPAQPQYACGLHLEPWRRQPRRLVQGLDLGTPGRTRGGGSRASAEGSRDAEALLRPLRGRRRDAPRGQTPWTLLISMGRTSDPEVYLDKVCRGRGNRPRYITPQIMPPTFAGVWEEGFIKQDVSGWSCRGRAEDKGAWADLNWPEVGSLRSPGLMFS